MARKGVGMRVVRPYGTCDEGAVCSHAVQVALGTDHMKAPQKPFGSDDRHLRCGCPTGESQGSDNGRISTRHPGCRLEGCKRKETVCVGFGRTACYDMSLSKMYCTKYQDL